MDDEHDRRVEVAAGLPPGAIASIAFAPQLLQPAIVGRVTDEQWRAGIAVELQQQFPHVSGADVVQRWSAWCGRVDQAMFQLVQQYRQRLFVGLLTNATTKLASDLAHLGITDAFDDIFSSAVIGYAKPSPQIFRVVLTALGRAPGEVAYIDDTPIHVNSAATLGINAIQYRDIAQLRESLNVVVGPAS